MIMVPPYPCKRLIDWLCPIPDLGSSFSVCWGFRYTVGAYGRGLCELRCRPHHELHTRVRFQRSLTHTGQKKPETIGRGAERRRYNCVLLSQVKASSFGAAHFKFESRGNLESVWQGSMKLNDEQVQHIEAKTGVEPIPDTTITHDQLKEHFGDHSFYLDATGVYVWEPVSDASISALQLKAFQLASWINAEHTALERHEPAAKDQDVTIP